MAAIDHIVYAAPNLAAGTAAVEALVGMSAAPGGPHPGMGTRNTLMSLGDDVYLEIIAPDPEQPDPPNGRPFYIDAMNEGRLITFAIHASDGETIEDVTAAMAACGEDPGPISAMSRVKPDGEEIHWSLTMSAGPGLVPFVIEWGNTTHPATVTPTGCTLVSLSGTHPDPDHIRALHSAIGIEVDVTAGDTVTFAATLDTPNGRVTLL
ncbi:MAG: VOC family protein [Acidimicrobiales bacterium]|nr:VOC family protein [Acidimicrobiales bacterium]MYB82044.1 VOC family protein [Acidimicrobiales bacterium]MYI12524.1 VOC family protein [Acidimicrobiales bacterium]